MSDGADPELTHVGALSTTAIGGGGRQRWEASPDGPDAVADWAHRRLLAEADPEGVEEALGPRSWVVRRHRGPTISITGVRVFDVDDPDDRPAGHPLDIPHGSRSLVEWSHGSFTPPPPPPAEPPPPPATVVDRSGGGWFSRWRRRAAPPR